MNPSAEPPHASAERRRPASELTVASFSGPLPPPALLAQYNDAVPNGAERILAMVERQSAHREQIERAVVNGNLASQTRGTYLAFVIVMTAILCGSYLIHENKDAAGLTAIITAVAGVVGVFFYSRREQRKERVEKLAALEARRER